MRKRLDGSWEGGWLGPCTLYTGFVDDGDVPKFRPRHATKQGRGKGERAGVSVNTMGEKKKVTRRKVGQLGGVDYERTVESEASVGLT